jgi:hypothetical protein
VWCSSCASMVEECPHVGRVVNGAIGLPDDMARLLNAPGRLMRQALTYLTFRQEVHPNQMVHVTVQPQVPFKSLRLVVDPLMATAFMFHDVRIGNNIQGASASAGVRCTVFPADPLDKLPVNNLEGISTCSIGQLYSLTVENVSHENKEFSAMVWGVTIV